MNKNLPVTKVYEIVIKNHQLKLKIPKSITDLGSKNTVMQNSNLFSYKLSLMKK